MSAAPSADLGALIRLLLERGVNFTLVGGMAAVAQGAPVTTFDVDIVHAREPANVERLLRVLTELHAVVRDPAQRRLPPDSTSLMGRGHSLCITDLGPVDCLGAVERGLGYDELLPLSVDVPFFGMPLRVLGMQTLVELKELWDDEESRARAAVMRRVLEARRSGGG